MADSRNAVSPGQEPRKAVERRRRPEILPQEPNRMIGCEIDEASVWTLQERAPVSQRLIQPSEMRAQLIKMVEHRRHHYDRSRFRPENLTRSSRNPSGNTSGRLANTMPTAGRNIVFSAHQASASAAP